PPPPPPPPFMSPAALPWGAEVSGSITRVDATASTVTLADGNTYVLPVGFDVAFLQAGAKVKIVYDEIDGKLAVVAVEAAT
ncbi:MAG: DUF1344 domain-containing protein, partial [Bauldia sp.]